jgi:hypothetical protein
LLGVWIRADVCCIMYQVFILDLIIATLLIFLLLSLGCSVSVLLLMVLPEYENSDTFPVSKSLHWFKINKCILFPSMFSKLINQSTHKLQTIQPVSIICSSFNANQLSTSPASHLHSNDCCFFFYAPIL